MIIIMINEVILGQHLTIEFVRILTQMCSPCKNSRQITANAKIHGKRQNSRLPWIPWIRDFPL